MFFSVEARPIDETPFARSNTILNIFFKNPWDKLTVWWKAFVIDGKNPPIGRNMFRT